MSHSPTRRRALKRLASAPLWPLLPIFPVVLSGCGFALSRAPALPFERIALQGFAPRSLLAEELTRHLNASARVVLPTQQPDVILHALQDKRDKRMSAVSAAGQVREVQLSVMFEFRLATPGGKELLARNGVGATRDMSFTETIALAKELEQEQLYATLQSEVVMQVLRRLAKAPKA